MERCQVWTTNITARILALATALMVVSGDAVWAETGGHPLMVGEPEVGFLDTVGRWSFEAEAGQAVRVTTVVYYINDPGATMYDTARAEKCFDEIAGDARVAVRMATAGAALREIQRTLEDWEGGLNSLQVFFFVAATAERHMLQECWFDPSD